MENSKHSLVLTSQMWEFAVFKCFIFLYIWTVNHSNFHSKFKEKWKNANTGRADQGISLRGYVLFQEAAVEQLPRPQLDSHNAEDEKDKEAEEKDISQHGQGVQQQCHQDPHAYIVGHKNERRRQKFLFSQ